MNFQNIMNRWGKHFGVSGLALGVLLLWQFPTFWYAEKEGTIYQWFGLNEEIPEWEFNPSPVGDAAEAVLKADQMDNGFYQQEGGAIVRTFSAKRFEEKENAVGLFSHTPDRCWTNTGMVIEDAEPYFIEVEISGIKMIMERRVFSGGRYDELVYFGALVGGEALPYRMDQYLGSGRRRKGAGGDTAGSVDRLFNSRVWTWAFESFAKRARLAGPQQLIRVSTPVVQSIKTADERLLNFLRHWLVVVDYEEERKRFEQEREKEQESQ